MIALVDADSIIYRVCCALEEKIIWNEPEYLAGLEEADVEYTIDLDYCYVTADALVENIMFACEAKKVLLVFSGENNFRLQNELGYKTHRKVLRKPEGYSEVLSYLQRTYDSFTASEMEADDYVVYLKTKYPKRYMIASIDKDVLYQTVGRHYNYKTEQYINVTPKSALVFMYFQALTGDTADGYKGCPGIGEVKAKKILGEVVDNYNGKDLKELEYLLYNKVLETYISKGLSESDCINTLRLCSMHQFNGKVIDLYVPPIRA